MSSVLYLIIVLGAQRNSRRWWSTTSFFSDNEEGKNNENEEGFNDFLGEKAALQLQGVDPRKGWGFRGVHKVFLLLVFK